ncbi:hypothetical protein WME99_50650 [Sorangium sp. So ce136]|uniref:hypothetical protein n=1 Tax=Sorangium sp. So ce136 TaxID=3133284 RepID=UPI003F011F9F
MGDIREGHERLDEERGTVRHFLARQVGDTRARGAMGHDRGRFIAESCQVAVNRESQRQCRSSHRGCLVTLAARDPSPRLRLNHSVHIYLDR